MLSGYDKSSKMPLLRCLASLLLFDFDSPLRSLIN